MLSVTIKDAAFKFVFEVFAFEESTIEIGVNKSMKWTPTGIRWLIVLAFWSSRVSFKDTVNTFTKVLGCVTKNRTAKGIKKSAIRKSLSHAAYRDVLLNEEVTKATMNLIRSARHKLFSITCNKLALSAYDDKRYVLEDKFSTRPHGHYLNQLESLMWIWIVKIFTKLFLNLLLFHMCTFELFIFF